MDYILISTQKPMVRRKKGVKRVTPPPPDVLGADFFVASGLKLYMDFGNKNAFVEE